MVSKTTTDAALVLLVCSAPLLALGVWSLTLIGEADAQTIPPISLSADFDVYGPGETIHVNGLVEVNHGGAITIRVLSPTGNVVAVGQVVPENRDWSWSIPAEFQHDGTYTILANYALGRDAGRHASTTFVFTSAVEGIVGVNGTDFAIFYAGDPVTGAYTDAENSLIYIEFDGPASGVLRFSDGLYMGNLVVVEGGSLTALEGGSYAYAADSTTMILSADAVAVPEFGMGVIILLGTTAALSVAAIAARQRLPQ